MPKYIFICLIDKLIIAIDSTDIKITNRGHWIETNGILGEYLNIQVATVNIKDKENSFYKSYYR